MYSTDIFFSICTHQNTTYGDLAGWQL